MTGENKKTAIDPISSHSSFGVRLEIRVLSAINHNREDGRKQSLFAAFVTNERGLSDFIFCKLIVWGSAYLSSMRWQPMDNRWIKTEY